MNNKTIILANGSFPKSKELIKILDNAKQIICCDGAVNNLAKSGREPHVIIGDLDSVNPELKEKYKDRLIYVDDQNSNDLTKAVNWCFSEKIKNITILGATGKREDHTIANVSLLSNYQKKVNIKMLTDNGIFIPISETTTFNSFEGQQISIFSQNLDTEISSTGLKYPLQNLKLTSWWMGTLNEAISTKFTISLSKESSVIIYLLNQ